LHVFIVFLVVQIPQVKEPSELVSLVRFKRLRSTIQDGWRPRPGSGTNWRVTVFVFERCSNSSPPGGVVVHYPCDSAWPACRAWLVAAVILTGELDAAIRMMHKPLVGFRWLKAIPGQHGLSVARLSPMAPPTILRLYKSVDSRKPAFLGPVPYVYRSPDLVGAVQRCRTYRLGQLWRSCLLSGVVDPETLAVDRPDKPAVLNQLPPLVIKDLPCPCPPFRNGGRYPDCNSSFRLAVKIKSSGLSAATGHSFD